MTRDMMQRLTLGKHVEGTEGTNIDSTDGTQYDVSHASDEDTNFRFAAGDEPALSSRESTVSSDCDDDNDDASNASDESANDDMNSGDDDIHASNSNFRYAAGDGPALSNWERAVSSDCDDNTQAQLRNADEAEVHSDVEHDNTTQTMKRNRKTPARFDD